MQILAFWQISMSSMVMRYTVLKKNKFNLLENRYTFKKRTFWIYLFWAIKSQRPESLQSIAKNGDLKF
jgi:hypothetical protein